MSNIDETLAERGSRYGEFADHADITQSLKDTMRDGASWSNMEDDQKECLEMIAHKIGRIVNGDPDYVDSWTDIIGYTRLVEKRLLSKVAAPTLADALKAFNEKMKQPVEDEADKLLNHLRGLSPGVHVIYIDEESGEA